MCDKCGQIFSERADGWQIYKALTVKRNEDGTSTTVTVDADACPTCAFPFNPGDTVQPRLSAPDDPTPPYEKVTE